MTFKREEILPKAPNFWKLSMVSLGKGVLVLRGEKETCLYGV